MYRIIPADPRSMDPTFSYTVTEATIIDNIFPGYYQYHYLKRNPFELELCLGDRAPRVAQIDVIVKRGGEEVRVRGEEWRFRLRPGLSFQDDPCFEGGKGREVVAADILYAFRRIADPATECPIYPFLEDKVLGLAAFSKRCADQGEAAYSTPVEGLVLDPRDPYVFTIRLNQSYPQLRYLMAMHFTTPIPVEAVRRYGDDFKTHPVGCGPYKLEEYTPRQRIVLVVNPNRRRETYPVAGAPGDADAGLLASAGQPLPLTDRIVFNINRETITGWNLFLQGYLDGYSVSQDNFRQAISQQGNLTPEMREMGVRLGKATGLDVLYFIFNMEDRVLGGYTPQRQKLRQAISLAIDSQTFLDLFSQGYGVQAEWLIPPGIVGHDSGYRNPYRRYDPDLKLAKRLLAEAGYPGGIDKTTGRPLTIVYDNAPADAAGRQEVNLAIKQIERLGIRVESRSRRDVEWQEAVDEGKFQLTAYGWVADYPDAENFAFLLYGPNGVLPGGRRGPNHSGYRNPRYDAIFEKMRAMADGPERVELIRQLREISQEDCPLIYREHTETLQLFHSWLKNVKPHPVSNDWLKYRGLDPAQRARMQREWNRPVYWPSLSIVGLLVLGSVPAIRFIGKHRRRRLRREGAA